MVEFLLVDELKRRILDYVESKDWWVIPHWTKEAGELGGIIERTYYDGEANGDFQIIMGPMMGLPFFSVSFAHKRRMSPWKLAGLMVGVADNTGAGKLSRAQLRDALRTQDILLPLPAGGGMEEEVGRATEVWEAWLRSPSDG